MRKRVINQVATCNAINYSLIIKRKEPVGRVQHKLDQVGHNFKKQFVIDFCCVTFKV